MQSTLFCVEYFVFETSSAQFFFDLFLPFLPFFALEHGSSVLHEGRQAVRHLRE